MAPVCQGGGTNRPVHADHKQAGSSPFSKMTPWPQKPKREAGNRLSVLPRFSIPAPSHSPFYVAFRSSPPRSPSRPPEKPEWPQDCASPPRKCNPDRIMDLNLLPGMTMA
jgi:hypothetical protein